MSRNSRKNQRDRAFFELVAEYENSSRQGEPLYLDEHTYGKLIDYYEEEARFDRALEVAGAAIERYRFTADFYLRKAQLLIQMNQGSAALETLDEASMYSPSELEVCLLRAEALAYMGHYYEALDALEPFKTEADPEDLSDIFLLESLVFEQQEMFDRAFDALRSALRVNHRNREALERLWYITEMSRRQKASRKLLYWLLDEDPFNAFAWHNLGNMESYFGDYEAAMEAYEYAFLLKPNYEDAYYDYADLCFESRRYEKALDAYREVEDRFELDPELYLQMGRCYQRLQQFDRARFYYHKSLKMDGHSDEVLFYLGESYAEEEKWPQALHYLEKAVEREDQQEDYHLALAEVAWRMDDLTRAEAAYLQAIELASEEGRLWTSYAWFLLETGRERDALDVMNEAAEQAVGPDVAYGYVGMLLSLGRRQEAMTCLTDALQAYYHDHPLLFEQAPDLQQDPDVTAIISLYKPL